MLDPKHPILEKQQLLRQLDAVENLAKANKINRLLRQPLRYLYAIGYRELLYPLRRKGVLASVSTFFGLPMRLVLPASTDIYITGGKPHPSEVRLARFLIQNLQPGDHFLDIGAHFGYFSLLASVLVQDQGRVAAFEASASTFELLQQNTKPHSNIQIFHQAVSDTNEPLSFYQFPVLYSEYNSLEISQFEQEAWFKKFQPEKITVPAVTLDALLLENKIQPKIIKIDVEGAEDKVIAGGADALQQQNPFLVLEYLEPSRHNEPHRRAAQSLQKNGYQSFTINKNGALVLCEDIENHLAIHQLDSDNIVFHKKPNA